MTIRFDDSSYARSLVSRPASCNERAQATNFAFRYLIQRYEGITKITSTPKLQQRQNKQEVK